jgi:hypothetical protein
MPFAERCQEVENVETVKAIECACWQRADVVVREIECDESREPSERAVCDTVLPWTDASTVDVQVSRADANTAAVSGCTHPCCRVRQAYPAGCYGTAGYRMLSYVRASCKEAARRAGRTARVCVALHAMSYLA